VVVGSVPIGTTISSRAALPTSVQAHAPSETAGDRPPVDISVVIPCYNAAPWLSTQLEALANQQYDGPWEVIVADNGSTDGSVAVARSFAPRFERLTVHDAGAVQGSSYACNAGAAVATGSAIAFCDADDEVAPGWLAAMAAALRAHSVVGGRFEGEKLNESWTLRSRELPQQNGLQGTDAPPYIPHAGSGNMGFTKEAWQDSGGFAVDMPVFGDTDLCWRLAERGYEIFFEPAAVVHVRLRASLSGIWRQAYSYGGALADLHARHEVRMSVRPLAGLRWQLIANRAALLALPLRCWNKGSLAELLWEYGWRAGRLVRRCRTVAQVIFPTFQK
jgi:glycosyltransferase involved in cell wall biosynthesis